VNAARWSRYLSEARADAALSAYTTALDWFHRYPAAEVERRLVEMIAAKCAAAAARIKPKGATDANHHRDVCE
jgi:hypothetical protein